jgi:hypothetical protein
VSRLAAVVALCFALASGAAASTSDAYWPVAKVLARIDGARVSIDGRRVRVVSASTLCSGEGPSLRRRGVRMWRRFACTYTTFTKAGVDRDLEFRVRVRDGRRFRIADAHWIGVSR